MASSDGRNTSAQSNLRQQNLAGLDVTKLSALSPEVISRQATINIGTIGHVAHGKSTVVKAISGVQTVRFKNELERNITIKLERLSESVVRLFHERATEREESMIYKKLFKRSKKRNLTPEPEDMPPAKKKKGNKQEEDEFIIEKILDIKFESGKEYLYVKWKGYNNANDNTWEPIEHLANCPLVITEYVNSMEVKYCDALENLKQEISFDNLLEEENLVDRLKESEEIDMSEVKSDLILKLLFILNLDESEEDHASQLVQDARDLLQLYTVCRKRCNQLVCLKKWEEHLNQVDTSKKLTVENDVDFTGPPEDFKYINQSIPGLGVTVPDDPPIGCDCTFCNCRTKTCCGTQGGYFPYTTKKRLRVASGTPIYECNKACKCSQDCCNRVVQHGRNIKLCIFRTSNGRGWGVRAEQKIYQGQFICQYSGEIITFEEAEKRGREYDANGLTYLFDLDFNSTDNPYTIDAALLGNVSHFINHSCEPNLGTWAVWADCLDPNLPMLAFFANCDIEAGEEICFDYLQKASDSDDGPSTSTSASVSSEVRGAGVLEPASPTAAVTPVKDDGSTSKDASPTKSRFAAQQQANKPHRNLTECCCGALTCRKYLF